MYVDHTPWVGGARRAGALRQPDTPGVETWEEKEVKDKNKHKVVREKNRTMFLRTLSRLV